MNLVLRIAPKIILAILALYIEINRVFMEYIDNAIDSADEHYYDKYTNSYTKPIHIKIWLSATSYRDAIFVIEDNCYGISDITRITNSLGDSYKDGNSILNGQYGLGCHAYMEACEEIEFTSKTADSYVAKSIKLNSKMFDKSKIEDVELGDVIEIPVKDNSSWTKIKLSGFKKDRYKEISLNNLKEEIEKHFENVLRRKNLTITVQRNDQFPVTCIPFDYNQYPGEIYSKTIDKLYYRHSKRLRTEKEIDISEHPVKVHLKIINGKSIERKPVFIIKGRRIIEIADLRALRTISKSEIWSHPNITGYIDVTGCLRATIARNEFIHNSLTKALFYTLLKLEPEIKVFIKDSLGREVESKFKKLESILNSALNDIARHDKLKNQDILSDEEQSKTESKLLKNNEQLKKFTIKTQNENAIKDESEKSNANYRRGGKAKSANPRPWVKTFLELPVSLVESSRKHSNSPDLSNGLNIKIDNENEPQKDINDKLLRSLLVGSDIMIYRKHPEFEERLDCTIHGIPRITQALITYLSSEILFHYKSMTMRYSDKKFESKDIILDFIETLYLLESKLVHIKNKKISDFS